MQLSDEQYFSHGFLLALGDKQKCWRLAAQRSLHIDETRTENPYRLIVVSPMLNVDLLWQVLSALELGDVGFTLPASNRRLSTQSACFYLSTTTDELAARMASISASLHCELALLHKPPTLAEPGLLLMDMDSTMIACECIDDIAQLAGVGQQVSEVTELAMQGKLDFADSLVKRVACLQGTPQSVLEQVKMALPIMPGMVELLRELKAQHWKVALASGGFSYFADYLRQRLDLDDAIANDLAFSNGQLTGRVSGNIVDADVKAQTLTRLQQKYGIAATQTVAMGDGANDLKMLAAARLGVAFHAKPIVAKQSMAQINRLGLETLIHYLQ